MGLQSKFAAPLFANRANVGKESWEYGLEGANEKNFQKVTLKIWWNQK
jgi:hypothetical protein